jgi:hypothetical protein
MSIVMQRRLHGHHALLELALREERARVRPDDHVVVAIKKKKLSIKDRLMALDRAVQSTHR